MNKIATDFPHFQHLGVEKQNRYHILRKDFLKFFSDIFWAIPGIFALDGAVFLLYNRHRSLRFISNTKEIQK